MSNLPSFVLESNNPCMDHGYRFAGVPDSPELEIQHKPEDNGCDRPQSPWMSCYCGVNESTGSLFITSPRTFNKLFIKRHLHEELPVGVERRIRNATNGTAGFTKKELHAIYKLVKADRSVAFEE